MEKNNFKIGADPEFMMLNHHGEPLNAGKELDKEFGSDGCQWIFEVRPKPTTNPIELIHNIQKIFKRSMAKMPEYLDYNWMAGSFVGNANCHRPIAGHIHFGMKELSPNWGEADSKDATFYLSQYVGALSICIENKEVGKKRRMYDNDHHYGNISDWRPQPHGFEYRTPSSWLTSPYVAAGIVALSKVVMYNYINTAKLTIPDYVDYNSFQRMTPPDEETISNIWTDIQGMSLYREYKDYINILPFLIKNKMNWFPSGQNMKEAWNLV
jgi:hypothetical protein